MPPRPAPTHFLCIPLVTSTSRPQLLASLAAFRADVTSADSFALPEQSVRPLGTLHLTLGVMSFPPHTGNGNSATTAAAKDGNGLERAVALLKSLVPGRTWAGVRGAGAGTTGEETGAGKEAPPPPPPPPLSLTLRGLRSMQAASRASVLYAAPDDEEGTLRGFCEGLRARFLEEGLMVEDGRPLLLHATIVNTIYVRGGRGSGGGKGRQGGKRLTVDARRVLERYGDQVWMADVPVEKVAICRMGAKKGEDGEEAYEVEAEIDV
ncbi:AKAP7 2'5' RNA ligase-like domain-containing protein [Xylariaceae sp. FL0016]|nr:AKAP7 2'5' RNA ligase-like domain-containing protein [Xylariaceae sp. FL0016]